MGLRLQLFRVAESKRFPFEGHGLKPDLPLPTLTPRSCRLPPEISAYRLDTRGTLKVDTVPSYILSLATLPLTSWGHFSPRWQGTPTAIDQGGPGSRRIPGFGARGGCCRSVAAVRGRILTGGPGSASALRRGDEGPLILGDAGLQGCPGRTRDLMASVLRATGGQSSAIPECLGSRKCLASRKFPASRPSRS